MKPQRCLLLLLSFCFWLPTANWTWAADKRQPKRKATTEVKIYRDGDLPSEPLKELSVFTDDGGLDEEESIVGKFIQKAKKLGADVLVLGPLIQSGAELKPFGFGATRTTYLYRGRAYYFDSGGEILKSRGERAPAQLPPTTGGDGNRLRGSGSGFFITRDRYFITNDHVVEGARSIKLLTSKGEFPARIIQADRASDLALLKIDGSFPFLPIKASRSVRLGDTVATVGFPNPALQGFSPKLAKGEIGSLAGAKDDPKMFQISLPVQPGNSGGALVDASGNVVGVIVAKLNARAAIATSGAFPENVNYAIKSSFLLGFLESTPDVANRIADPTSSQTTFDQVIHSVESASAMVLIY